MKLSGRNTASIGTPDIFEQKQKKTEVYSYLSKIDFKAIEGIHQVIKYLPEAVFLFLSRQNRDNWNKSLCNKAFFQYFSLSFLKKEKELVNNYISKFKQATNNGINTAQALCAIMLFWVLIQFIVDVVKHHEIKGLHIRKLTELIKLYHLLVN